MAWDFTKTARKIEQLGREAGKEVGSGLRVIGEHIMTDIKASRPNHGVPVKSGALRSSGRVTGPRKRAKNPVVKLVFGGASAPYALRQHEVRWYRHRVGEARYLVRGVERFAKRGLSGAPEALEAMKRAARAAIKKARRR